MNITSLASPAITNDRPRNSAVTTPVSDGYLAQAEDRAAAASAGPWTISRDGYGIVMGFGPFSWVRTWNEDELEPSIAFCVAARTDVPALVGEIRQLRTKARRRVRTAARRARVSAVRRAGSFGSALPWAVLLHEVDLGEFLGDLATAADGGEDLATLAAVERVIDTYRTSYARPVHGRAIA